MEQPEKTHGHIGVLRFGGSTTPLKVALSTDEIADAQAVDDGLNGEVEVLHPSCPILLI